MKLIPLTQNKFAIVDDEDYDWLNQFKWHYSTGYAMRRSGKEVLLMHREIMNTPKGMESDHEDGKGLNNRKYNLRVCTHAQNMSNQKARVDGVSKYKGVYWKKDRNKWGVKIVANYKQMHVGYFTDEIKAAKAYDAKALEFFGEFARINFPG